MDKENQERPSKKGLSVLEKSLILLFLAMTGACIGLVVVYVIENNNSENSEKAEEVLVSGCGGPMQLSGQTGEFTSGNYPSNYDDGKSCTWHITVERNKVIHLWFQDFSLEDSITCSADSLTFSDNTGIIGKYCGPFKPKPIVSLGNSLVVYFDTNDRGADKGFRASYRAVAPETATEIAGAGGLLQGDRGELMTPGFPEQSYENDALYQWRIAVSPGERVRLTFTEFSLAPNVCGDYVDVFDGLLDGNSSSKLGHFCGNKVPAPVISNSNEMVVRFKSDSSLTARGFSAVYSVADTSPITTTTSPATHTTTSLPSTITPSTDSGCGSPGNLFGRKGEIRSKGFPAAYPANLHCIWNISVTEGFLVKLHITDLSIVGEAGQCSQDVLTVFDSQQSLGPYCGFILPPVLVSVSNKMSLSFRSDSRLADRGFLARWEAVYPEDIAEIQGCGGSSQQETGVIKSENWPMNYPPNRECQWRVQVPEGKTMTLTFTEFDVESGDLLLGRCYDNVVVYDGTKTTSRKYGPYCGTKIPPIIRSTGRELVVRFHSDFFTEAKGFRAYWTTDSTLPIPTEPPVPPNPWDSIPIEWPDSCGRPKIPPGVNARIVNGEPAKDHSWPWQVSMQVWPDSQPSPTFFHTCGGTLIHKHWVLTAAHCFIRYADELQRWQMCLGKHNLTQVEPGQLCLRVRGIYRHDGFRYPSVPSVEFDIALVRLDGEVTPTDHIDFACLPSVEEMLPGGKKCYATGWGDETGNSMAPKVAETLNQAALPVVPYSTCQRMDYWWFQVKPSMICCGYTLPDELKSVCQGDSGGPLVCQDSPTAPWEVHGITSFGPIGCVMNKKPSVFTRSSAYLAWIENTIRKDIYDLTISGCGGPKDQVGTEGVLASMNHPQSYENGALCRWRVRVPAGKRVHLHFSAFSLEGSQPCLSDRVSISDEIGPLGTHCSTSPPADLVAAGDTLTINFSSNNRVVDTGFSATWRSVDPVDIGNVVGCGGEYHSQQGELQSPNWPSPYPGLTACTWTISSPSAKSIHIAFTHFELQAVDLLGKCVDYVEVFDAAGMSQGVFCGFVPPKLAVSGDKATVRFITNGVQEEKGFRGYWTTDPNVFPTLAPAPPNPWDDVLINWPAKCGTPAVSPVTTVTKVVNGVEAKPHSWPWQVSMQLKQDASKPFKHACGGSLIHEQWILTAAHCFLQFSSAPSWQMCVGKHHLDSSLDSVPEVCVPVAAIISHKGFADSSGTTDDVALVRLAKPLPHTPEISAACLPEPEVLLPAGHVCYVTGWGDEKGSLIPVASQRLNQAPLPIVPYETCSKPGYWWEKVRPSMICAGYESPEELKAACQGDLGGPFVCRTGGGSTWEVHGVVSFVPRGCVKDKKPSVFTRVSAFRHWIDDSIKQYLYENAA